MGVHWKAQLLGREFMKNQYRGGDCLKREAWTVCRFKGGLGKKEGGGVFEGVWYPNAHYGCALIFKTHLEVCLKCSLNKNLM